MNSNDQGNTAKKKATIPLVVTRPIGQAEGLLKALAKIDKNRLNCLHAPLISIQAVDFTWPIQNPSQPSFNSVVFISTNAAKFFYQKASLANKTRLFAVGNNTAALVEQLSRQTVIFPQHMNAEGLLALPEFQSVKGQNWLIVKGEKGRETLHEKLVEIGALVTSLDVYRREMPIKSVQQQIMNQLLEQSSIWLITSAQALMNLEAIILKAQLTCDKIQVVISSERLLALAQQKGFKIISQSRGASEQQLVECVQALI